MSELTLFIQVQGESQVVEVAVAEGLTGLDLHNALASVSVAAGPDVFIFVDEHEDHVLREVDIIEFGLKHGARVHVAHCHRITTTVHYNGRTVEHAFPPGTRVRNVKKWTAREFHIDHKDAAEHVLQFCKSTKQPPSDTPIHALTHDRECTVCFDLVPEKRVEGCL